MKSSTLLEQIYYGEFFPGEHPQTRDQAYLAACKEADQGIRYLSEALSGEQRERFDALIRAMQEMSGREAYANFACGFRAGARLMREISDGDENPRSFGG